MGLYIVAEENGIPIPKLFTDPAYRKRYDLEVPTMVLVTSDGPIIKIKKSN